MAGHRVWRDRTVKYRKNHTPPRPGDGYRKLEQQRLRGEPLAGTDEELIDWLSAGQPSVTNAEVQRVMEMLMFRPGFGTNGKKTGTDYVRVSVVGDSLWLPAPRVEKFLRENPYAEISDLLPAELVRERFDVLNGDDLELLHDAGATWAVGMQNCPWTPDFLRQWNAVILAPKEK